MRSLVLLLLAIFSSCCSWSALAAREDQGVGAEPLQYVNVETLGVHGKGFTDTMTFYDRLPAAAKGIVSDAVWDLSLDTAGMYTQFETDSNEIAIETSLRSGTMEMWHFPSTGVSGLDLYLWDTNTAVWRWVGTTRTIRYPQAVVNTMLIGGHPVVNGSMGLYRLHLPLYNGIANLSIGIQKMSKIVASPPDFKYKGAVVWYGTSIAQGGVASRPGQAFTNVIGRDLGLDMYNFGFSGHGLMEADVAKFLVNISDISLFIVDCNPNMDASEISERTVPLVKQIASAHPTANIVLAEGTTYGTAWYNTGVSEAQAAKRMALQKAYQSLVAGGMKQLHYVNGSDLMCIDPPKCYINPTVGGTHPTDLGMRAIAKYYKTFLPTILKENDGSYKAKIHSWTGRPAGPKALDEAGLSAEQRREFFERAYMRKTPSSQQQPEGETMTYLSLTDLTVRGRAFNDTMDYFNRLPGAAKGVVRDEVFSLSQMSTGIHVRFVTNASTIYLNYTLGLADKSLWHMPLTGTSGCDLYVQYSATENTWRWVGTVRQFSYPNSQLTELAGGLPEGEHTYILYLPLRNTLLSGQIGVPVGSSLGPDSQYAPLKPIVWYGTSICQGGVASRAGTTYTNIISRLLPPGVEAWNFGFAGNGKMEIAVAGFLTQLDPAVYVIDCNPNLGATDITSRAQPLVKYFRQKHPTTPIILLEGTTYGDYWLHGGTFEGQDAKRKALRAAYNTLVAAGDQNLHYVNGSILFGPDTLINPTVGGTHPSDLGHHDFALAVVQHIAGTQLLP